MLALNQNIRVTRRDALDQIEKILHPPASADDVLELFPSLQLLLSARFSSRSLHFSMARSTTVAKPSLSLTPSATTEAPAFRTSLAGITSSHPPTTMTSLSGSQSLSRRISARSPGFPMTGRARRHRRPMRARILRRQPRRARDEHRRPSDRILARGFERRPCDSTPARRAFCASCSVTPTSNVLPFLPTDFTTEFQSNLSVLSASPPYTILLEAQNHYSPASHGFQLMSRACPFVPYNAGRGRVARVPTSSIAHRPETARGLRQVPCDGVDTDVSPPRGLALSGCGYKTDCCGW